MADFLGIFGFSCFIGHYYLPSGYYCPYVEVKEMETRTEGRRSHMPRRDTDSVSLRSILSRPYSSQVIVLLYRILVHRPSTGVPSSIIVYITKSRGKERIDKIWTPLAFPIGTMIVRP